MQKAAQTLCAPLPSCTEAPVAVAVALQKKAGVVKVVTSLLSQDVRLANVGGIKKGAEMAKGSAVGLAKREGKRNKETMEALADLMGALGQFELALLTAAEGLEEEEGEEEEGGDEA